MFMIINIDTKKMESCGTEMINLTQELRSNITSLFERLENIEEKCWRGVSAKKFVNSLANEKEQYLKFVDSLFNEGKYFLDSAEYLDKQVASIKENLNDKVKF